MGKSERFLEQLAAATDLLDETMPGVPLIEIAGHRRVLIEHHCGVSEYGREKICVKVKFGQISIMGSGLELARMTREQLIITGCINAVNLIRRGK